MPEEFLLRTMNFWDRSCAITQFCMKTFDDVVMRRADDGESSGCMETPSTVTLLVENNQILPNSLVWSAGPLPLSVTALVMRRLSKYWPGGISTVDPAGASSRVC